jgi:hypothetical protein
LEEATAVFEGRVDSVSAEDLVAVRFSVTRAFKGVESETIQIRTRENSAACGYRFVEGQTYLVYAYGEEGDLRVGLCSRTRLVEEAAEDVTELGAGVTPVDPNGPPEFEPYQGDEVPPASGGCASCTAHAHGAGLAWPGPMAALVIGWLFSRRRRRNYFL